MGRARLDHLIDVWDLNKDDTIRNLKAGVDYLLHVKWK